MEDITDCEFISDYELIYMIRQNDQTAYRLLYERYLPLIWSKVYECHKQYYDVLPDISDAFNACLITFHNVIYNYRLDRETLFGTYLYHCLDYCLKSYRRTTERYERNIVRGDLSDDFNVREMSDTSLKYDPVSVHNVNEIMRTINELLESYSETDREIIYQTISGRKGVDIANEYNISRKKYSYIVKKFREKALNLLEKKEYN